MRNLVFWLACGALTLAVLDLLVVVVPAYRDLREARERSETRLDADLERLRTGPYPSPEEVSEVREGAQAAADAARRVRTLFFASARRPSELLLPMEDRDGRSGAAREALRALLHTLATEVMTRDELLDEKLGLLLPSTETPLPTEPAELEQLAERALAVEFFLGVVDAQEELAIHGLGLRRSRDDGRLLMEWRIDGPPDSLMRCSDRLLAPSPRIAPRELIQWRLRRLEPREWGIGSEDLDAPPCRLECQVALWDPRGVEWSQSSEASP